jgi:hypothetical protein
VVNAGVVVDTVISADVTDVSIPSSPRTDVAGLCSAGIEVSREWAPVSYGPPWAHYLGGYQDRLLGGPLGLLGLRYTAPEGVEHKDYTGVVLG